MKECTFLNYEPSCSDSVTEFRYCLPWSSWCQPFPTMGGWEVGILIMNHRTFEVKVK